MFGRATIRLGIGPHSSSMWNALTDEYKSYVVCHNEPVRIVLLCDQRSNQLSYGVYYTGKFSTDAYSRFLRDFFLRELSFLYATCQHFSTDCYGNHLRAGCERMTVATVNDSSSSGCFSSSPPTTFNTLLL